MDGPRHASADAVVTPARATISAVLRRIATSAACRPARGLLLSEALSTTFETEFNMGKYFLAWLLGVPGIVLLVIYLFFH